MTTWTEMKIAITELMNTRPQPATLAIRAAQGVEDGLAFLASQGYNFEIAPRGTLGELQELKDLQMSLPLSIADASKLVTAPKAPMTSKFEAMTKRVS